MQDRQILPRWFVLRELIRVVSLLALMYILMYSGIARMSSLNSSRIPAAYFAFAVPSGAELVLLVVFTLFALKLIALLRNHALFESEQYLILVTLALVLSTGFGVANYAIYAFRPDAFSVDKDLLSDLSTSQEKEWKLRLADAQENVEGCEIMLRMLTVEQERYLQATVSPDGYRLHLPHSPGTIDVAVGTDPDEDEHIPTVVYSVNATVANRNIRIVRSEGILHGTPWGFSLGAHLYSQKRASVSELVQLFEKHKEWETSNWVAPLEKPIPKRPVHLTLFLYQAVMDMIGASPKYFAPKTFMSRALAFVYAFCKLVFFGMVITTLAKHFSDRRLSRFSASS